MKIKKLEVTEKSLNTRHMILDLFEKTNVNPIIGIVALTDTVLFLIEEINQEEDLSHYIDHFIGHLIKIKENKK